MKDIYIGKTKGLKFLTVAILLFIAIGSIFYCNPNKEIKEKALNITDTFLLWLGQVSISNNEVFTLVSGTITDSQNNLINGDISIYEQPITDSADISMTIKNQDGSKPLSISLTDSLFTIFTTYTAIEGLLYVPLKIGKYYKFCVYNDCNSKSFVVKVLDENTKIVTYQSGVNFQMATAYYPAKEKNYRILDNCKYGKTANECIGNGNGTRLHQGTDIHPCSSILYPTACGTTVTDIQNQPVYPIMAGTVVDYYTNNRGTNGFYRLYQKNTPKNWCNDSVFRDMIRERGNVNPDELCGTNNNPPNRINVDGIDYKNYRPNTQYGRFIVVRHDTRYRTFYSLYAHLFSISNTVHIGSEVIPTMPIGQMGNSDSTSYELAGIENIRDGDASQWPTHTHVEIMDHPKINQYFVGRTINNEAVRGCPEFCGYGSYDPSTMGYYNLTNPKTYNVSNILPDTVLRDFTITTANYPLTEGDNITVSWNMAITRRDANNAIFGNDLLKVTLDNLISGVKTAISRDIPNTGSYSFTLPAGSAGDKVKMWARVYDDNDDGKHRENDRYYTKAGKFAIETPIFSITQTTCSANSLRLSCPATFPEISIKVDNTEISSNGTYNFGSVQVGGNTSKTFTVDNTGSANLTINGNPIITGTNASDFSVTANPTSPVSANGSTSFSVKFNPTTAGTKSATLTVSNNDLDEGSYIISLSGTSTSIPVPEINVKVGSTNIASGGSHNFGSIQVGSNTPATFTIENIGSADLMINSNPSISGTNASDFSVTANPTSPISASGSSPFTVKFAPSTTGTKTATLTFTNNDSDEGTYTISISGTATTVPAPEINIKANSMSIASSGNHNFGSVPAGGNTSTTFTIENTGSASLTINSNPSIAGTNASDFSVTANPASSVSASGTTTFSVKFAPTTVGTKNATLTISNSDSDEGTYLINLSGSVATCSTCDIALFQGTPVSKIINSGGTVNFGYTAVNTTLSLTFAVQNPGSETLILTSNPTVVIGGSNPSDFTITPAQYPTSPVSSGGSIAFRVDFKPLTSGSKNATLTLYSNHPTKGTYTINITGTGNTVSNCSSCSVEIFQSPPVSQVITSGGSVNFGSIAINSTISIYFSVQNPGSENLILTASPSILFEGINNGDFTIIPAQYPTSPVSSGGSMSFRVDFKPLATGSRSAVLKLYSNHPTKTLYTLSVSGTGL